MSTSMSSLYDTDFVEWATRTADLLRRGRLAELERADSGNSGGAPRQVPRSVLPENKAEPKKSIAGISSSRSAGYGAENRIVSPAAIRRMNDVEYVSELMIGVLHGPQGGSAAIVDSYYQQYEDYEDVFPEQKRMQRVFDHTLQVIQLVYPDIKDTRWSNKTDFYTLFVGIASTVRSVSPPVKVKTKLIRKALDALAADVDKRIGDENANVSQDVIDYVRAVEKGANDKARRAERHRILTSSIEKYISPKTT
jgi:hypothetical protein